MQTNIDDKTLKEIDILFQSFITLIILYGETKDGSNVVDGVNKYVLGLKDASLNGVLLNTKEFHMNSLLMESLRGILVRLCVSITENFAKDTNAEGISYIKMFYKTCTQESFDLLKDDERLVSFIIAKRYRNYLSHMKSYEDPFKFTKTEKDLLSDINYNGANKGYTTTISLKNYSIDLKLNSEDPLFPNRHQELVAAMLWMFEKSYGINTSILFKK